MSDGKEQTTVFHAGQSMFAKQSIPFDANVISSRNCSAEADLHIGRTLISKKTGTYIEK